MKNSELLFNKIVSPVFIETKRLTIDDIRESDKENYAKLYLDRELNKWWGYDYSDDLNGQSPSPDYFYSFQKKLKENKEEYLLIVRLNDIMIGELVLYNFGDDLDVEIGFRFFREYQKKGYATESVIALINYVKIVLNATKVKSRCFKENVASKALIERTGFKKVNEDKTHYYFEQIITTLGDDL